MVIDLEILAGDVKVKTGDVEIKPACCHYWIIDPPNGSSSRGVCKFCSEVREFNNSVARYVIKKPRGRAFGSGARQVRKESVFSL